MFLFDCVVIVCVCWGEGGGGVTQKVVKNNIIQIYLKLQSRLSNYCPPLPVAKLVYMYVVGYMVQNMCPRSVCVCVCVCVCVYKCI